MNTVTHEEVQALGTVEKTPESAGKAPYNLLLVPLSRLRESGRNVRPRDDASVAELAASITRVGLLQNLTVTGSAEGSAYEVVAGMRRLAALRLLVKQRKIAKDHDVPCLLVPDERARTVSLTENVQRQAMHPVDQFAAFAALVAEGRAVEDVAADFGVTPLVVRRRLKLANVSPRLLADYRADAVSLEQLMALAVTDDHSAQEAAFYEAPHWRRDPHALREQLMQREIDAARDPLARFVGVAAYEAAGGAVRRDLFSEDEGDLILSDPALLESLACAKLGDTADQVRAEGWGWVEVVPRATPSHLHAFVRARRERRAPGKAEAKRIAKLQARLDAIDDKLNADDADAIPEQQAEALRAEGERLNAELDEIDESLQTYPSEVIAMAGAIVAVDQAGRIAVHRGLLREDEARALRKAETSTRSENGDSDGLPGKPAASGISEALARRLSAHRTVALQAELARKPQVALVAIVHRLALRVLIEGYGYGESPVNVQATPQDGLQAFAPDMVGSPALADLDRQRQAWTTRLAVEPQALFEQLLAMPHEEVLALLAVCVAQTVGAVTPRSDAQPAAALARAVGLDMHGWWKPTAEGYFAHVSKARTLEAVQCFAAGEVARLTKLKKKELALEAGRLAAGSGWLPQMLCAGDTAAAAGPGSEAA